MFCFICSGFDISVFFNSMHPNKMEVNGILFLKSKELSVNSFIEDFV